MVLLNIIENLKDSPPPVIAFSLDYKGHSSKIMEYEAYFNAVVLKVLSWTGSITSQGNLLEKRILRPFPGFTELETLDGAQQSVF